MKLNDRNHAITAADALNDRVLLFFKEHEVPQLRFLMDRGTEYCGDRETHKCVLCLDLEKQVNQETACQPNPEMSAMLLVGNNNQPRSQVACPEHTAVTIRKTGKWQRIPAVRKFH